MMSTELDFYSASSLNNSPRVYNSASLLNNSLQVYMSMHSDTLALFGANQTLFLLLKAVHLVEKQQITYVIVFDLIRPEQSTTLEATTLTISSPIRFLWKELIVKLNCKIKT